MSHLTSYDNNQYSDYFQTTLPSHWKEKRLNYIAEQNRNSFVDGPFGSDLKTSDYKDAGIPLIQLNNIRDGQHILRNIKFITAEKKDELARHIALPNDVVIAKMADPVARAAIVSDRYSEFVIVADCVKFTPDLNLIDLHYLIWAINCDCVRINAELVSTGTTRIRINLSELKKLKIPYPPLQEQTQIAAFLDHETAKIDTLIEKQQQLIELLKEKRQAVISHAVTKGLNPDAPMKDSGVEWLGEVPEHWDVCLFKHKCNEVTDGAHISPDLNDGAHYFVSIKDIKNGIINFDNALLTSSKSYDYLVKTGCMPFAGDILFSKDGTIGQTAITPSEIDFVVASSLIIIRPNRQQVVSEYLDFLLQSSLVQEQVESFIKGAALRRLSIQNLLKIFGVFPSLGEQKEIAVYIKNQLKKYSDLMIQANSQVKLLQERRTALISAAVTGKIDVRNWVAPTTSIDTNDAQQEVTA
ncbi:restriction endonuclease subunit S [Aliivibrio fischeri]|uniref:restriction endonuclease subunit S n=1 Tax=Aliivibrio fischeri TaxID=668 RepID=UPI003736BA24